MTASFLQFYRDVIRQPLFWIPLLFFSIAAFGYDLFSYSLSTDDLNIEYYTEAMLHSRWGMVLLSHLTGILHFVPFIDKYLALAFLLLSGIMFCFLCYRLCDFKNVICYTLTAGVFVTYPLISEIWGYIGANYYSTGGQLCSILAVLVLHSNVSKLKRYLIAGTLMLFPVSSYEAPVFSYLTLVFITTFLEHISDASTEFSFRTVNSKILEYTVPLALAITMRFLVSFLLYTFFDIDYHNVGATSISWIDAGLLASTISLISSILYNYILAALLYFPITEIVIGMLVFMVLTLYVSFRHRSPYPAVCGLFIILASFSMSLVQGVAMPYRAAQTIPIFLAFFVFISYYYIARHCQTFIRRTFAIMMMLICWYQGIYTNRILSLQLQCTANEAAMIHNIGRRIEKDYENKPCVFVSRYYIGKQIDAQIRVDTSSWNGYLFHKICSRIYNSPDGNANDQYVQTAVCPITNSYQCLKKVFAYYGYDIDVLGPMRMPYTPLWRKKSMILEEATRIAKERKMRPFEIYDNGEYLIVQLSGREYYNEFFSEE